MRKLIIIAMAISFLMAGNGKISGYTFFDYSWSDDENSFEIHRSYFGYKKDLSEKLSYELKLDVGRESLFQSDETTKESRLFVYVKYAKVDWKTNHGKLTFGMQGMNVFNIQEKTWGYRFVEKSAMDFNKWASSADLGIGWSKSFSDFHASMLVTNGNGYKKAEEDESKKHSFQLVCGEKKLSKNDGFNLGGIYVFEELSEDKLFGVFGGYAGNGLRIGGEFGQLGTTRLMSFYGNYNVLDKFEIFCRFDSGDLDNDKTSYAIAGLSYALEKGLTIAPNIRFSDNQFAEMKVNFLFKF